jgi:hypothetical protein
LCAALLLRGPEMRPKHQISVTNFVNDLRSGASRCYLMDKYGLSSRGLHRALAKLLDANAISREEIPEKSFHQYATLAGENVRDLLRHRVDFAVPVYEAARPEVHGRFCDVTAEGVKIAGLEARVGEIKTLVSLGDETGEVGPFEFVAQCRWFRRGAAAGDFVSGFHIVDISTQDRIELEKLIGAACSEI